MKKISYIIILSLLSFGCKKENDYTKIDKEIIEKYIADNNLTATATGTGLYFVNIQEGTGASPVNTSYVTLYYKGYLVDGTIFDQTQGAPTDFFVNKVIPGFSEGLKLMKKGGKAKLLIPSALGYGSTATGNIPANSVLIFDVDLQNIQ